MYRFLTILLLSSLAFGQQATAPPPTAPPSTEKPATPVNNSESARKARACLDETIKALGGQAYLTAQNRVEDGRIYHLYHGQSREVGTIYRLFNRFPDQDRLELFGRGNFLLPLPTGDVIMVSHQKKRKSDIVVIHNGDKGYETTYKGTAALDKDELTAHIRRRRHSLEQVLRKWINDPSVEYFYDRLAIVDGKPADQVSLLNSQNDSVTVYLDQNSHLPLKTSYNWRDPEDKQRNVEEEVYDNYRLEQGIMTPHSISRYFNGETSMQRFISEVHYNLKLADDMFEASVSYDPQAPLKKRK
jgi:hypothetical protein